MEALVSQYLTGELALLVTCLMIIGKVLKTYKYLDNRWIPLVLLPISIVIVFGIKGISYVNFLIAILCWGVAIGVHQTYKQVTGAKSDVTDKK